MDDLLKCRSFPIIVPDLQLIQCSWWWAAGEASQRSIASSNVGVFTNFLALLAQFWCIIQQLQFIFTVCISFGDTKWQHMRSILISFSVSALMNQFIFCFIRLSEPNVLCTHFNRTSDSNPKYPILYFLSAGKIIMDPPPPPFTHMLSSQTLC